MRNYDELLKAGTGAQLEKLLENPEKSGFDNINIEYALDRILDEFIELRDAIRKTGIPPITHLQLIRREAADVANFAHMIILRCDKELEE